MMANPDLAPGALLKSNLPSRFEMKKAKAADAEAHERTVYRLVTQRDHRLCRVCGRVSDPQSTSFLARGHHHHIQYRSAGGATETWNLVLLCAEHHDAVHVKRTLRIEGNADLMLTFWARDDQRSVVRLSSRDRRAAVSQGLMMADYGRHHIARRLARLIQACDNHHRPLTPTYLDRLAGDLHVCRRTVYRDLDALRDAGFRIAMVTRGDTL